MLRHVETPEPALGVNALRALSLVPVFCGMLKVRKDRAFPFTGRDLDTAAWSVYIDNLTEDEMFTFEDCKAVGDEASERMLATDKRYDVWRSPGSDGQAWWTGRFWASGRMVSLGGATPRLS